MCLAAPRCLPDSMLVLTIVKQVDADSHANTLIVPPHLQVPQVAGAVCRYVHPGTPAHTGLHQERMRSRREGAAAWLLSALPTQCLAPTRSCCCQHHVCPCTTRMQTLRAWLQLAQPRACLALLWLSCTLHLTSGPGGHALHPCVYKYPCYSAGPCSTFLAL